MRSRLFISLLLISTAFTWLPATAQTSLAVPLEVVRISNPDLLASGAGGVTVMRIQPQYTIQNVQGSSRSELSLGALIERSNNTSRSANRTLPSVRMLWEASSPVVVVSLNAFLEEASTRQTEFAEFGRVTRDSTQRTASLGGNWRRELKEGTSLALAGSHVRVSFDTPLLEDYSETSGSLTYGFEEDANSRYSLTASANHLKPDGGGENTSRLGIGLGYEWDISESFTLNVSAGFIRTSVPDQHRQPVGALRLNYQGERIGYLLAWSRDVSASGSLGAYARSETIDTSMTFPFTVNSSLSLGMSHASTLGANRDAGLTAFARFRSELTPFWGLTLGLEHRRSMPSSGPTARGYVAAVGLVYSNPDF